MSFHAIIYTKVNCPKCKLTVNLFHQYQIPYVDNYYGDPTKPNLIDLNNPQRSSWSQQKINKLKAKGVQSMPFVEVVDDTQSTAHHPVIIDSWSDFRPAKIKHLAQVYNTDSY